MMKMQCFYRSNAGKKLVKKETPVICERPPRDSIPLSSCMALTFAPLRYHKSETVNILPFLITLASRYFTAGNRPLWGHQSLCCRNLPGGAGWGTVCFVLLGFTEGRTAELWRRRWRKNPTGSEWALCWVIEDRVSTGMNIWCASPYYPLCVPPQCEEGAGSSTQGFIWPRAVAFTWRN